MTTAFGTHISPLPAAGKMTWSEFRQLEFDDFDPYIYELLNGTVMKRSAPSLKHQRVARKLLLHLDQHIETNGLGEIFPAPVDVYFDEHTGFQPDLAFVAADRAFLIEAEDYIHGAPDILVEIISPGSVQRDRVIKKEICQRFAVREFWLVDPQYHTVEIYIMQENVYALHTIVENSGHITSTVLTGLSLDIEQIFGEPIVEHPEP